MGRTYLSVDAESGGQVAVKALYPSRLADFKDLELFEREAQVLQKLDHPQIPAYIDSFHEGEGESTCYYLVQSYVVGETLRKKIADETRFSEAEIMALAQKLLAPLSYMHSLSPQVVHRDIKPDNIVLTGDIPTLVDFGAVREVVRLTMRGGSTVVGSYGYMPPEQLMGRAIPATDLYAVGITLLECLTRRRPGDLTGREAIELISQTSVSDGLKRILQRLCAPALAERYQTADEVSDDLKTLSAGGRLVHAAKLESAIVVREKDAEKALKKASRSGANIGFLAMVMFLILSAILGAVFLAQAVTASFETGFILVGALASAGFLLNLVLASSRYIHDAWEPPKPDWVEAEAEIEKYTEGIDPNTNAKVHLVHYSFPSKAGRYRHSRPFPDAALARNPVGTTFVVYHPKGRPELHEAVDFRRVGVEEMPRLYDRKRTYVPE